MDTFVILRRSGWRSADELGEAAKRSTAVGDNEVRLQLHALAYNPGNFLRTPALSAAWG